jgi:hypothetical protein
VPWTSVRSWLSKRSCSARRRPWLKWRSCWCCEKCGSFFARGMRKAFAGDGGSHERREGSHLLVLHKLSEVERQRILLICNHPEYASVPPGQIMPALSDQGFYNSCGEVCVYGSESSSRLRGLRSEAGLGLGHHLPAHHLARDLAVPLPGDRCLEPQVGGLGLSRAGRPSHRSRFGQQGLPQRADQQAAQAAVDPAC